MNGERDLVTVERCLRTSKVSAFEGDSEADANKSSSSSTGSRGESNRPITAFRRLVLEGSVIIYTGDIRMYVSLRAAG